MDINYLLFFLKHNKILISFGILSNIKLYFLYSNYVQRFNQYIRHVHDSASFSWCEKSESKLIDENIESTNEIVPL